MQVFKFKEQEDEKVQRFIKDCEYLGYRESQIIHHDNITEVTIFDVELNDNTLFKLKEEEY